jgi:hypothetical protein
MHTERSALPWFVLVRDSSKSSSRTLQRELSEANTGRSSVNDLLASNSLRSNLDVGGQKLGHVRAGMPTCKGMSPPSPSPVDTLCLDDSARVRFADAATRARLGGAGTLVLRIEKVGPAARGRLSDVIDEAMERELAARGATSPGVGSTFDPDAALSDQLFRARQVGVKRVCVALGPLGAASSPSGALLAEDAGTLLFLARATSERPLELVLDTTDEQTEVFITPVALKDALVETTAVLRAPAIERVDLEEIMARPVPPRADDPPEVTGVHAAIEKHSVGAAGAVDDSRWRHWMLALHAAKGPQPLASFERLFAQSYVPLCEAIDHGLSDARAVHARDEFRASFNRMYIEACPAFAATGKRPKMVLDAPDAAARMARLHGARSVQLLLVSWMRYDVGMRVRAALDARGLAGVPGETLLWSALPTTTSRQLDCLTRGVDALRGPVSSERDLEVVRGRTIEAVRRVKIGSRDVFKLDACEAKIRGAGAGASEALSGIAETLELAVAKHVASLAPGTLLFIFGDHGFTFDGSGSARSGGATPEEVLAPAFGVLAGGGA